MLKPIKVKVKSLWEGKVGIRDKYLAEAMKEQQGIAIEHKGQTMVIPYEKLTESIAGKSEQPFQDRFSRSWHYLIYFVWKPQEEKQATLFNQ